METYLGFWEKLARPIVGLAPMDGVTDAACRYITARYGRPDLVFTEFITTDGLFHNPEKILPEFQYHEIERPVVAQIYGPHPDFFYRATLIVCALGFDGIDINMGCPAKSVLHRNCGGKLITLPHLALEILAATRQAIEDWVAGKTLEAVGFEATLIQKVEEMNRSRCGEPMAVERRRIPFSVKTRIGYHQEGIEEWVTTLLKAKPAAITIHGRTLRQMYKGEADWSAIAKAAKIIRKSRTLVLGNGDIASLQQATNRILETGVDGVLIGRAAIGNPWIFQRSQQPVSGKERIGMALQHLDYWEKVRGGFPFKKILRHLGGYLSHFHAAAVLRQQVFEAKEYRKIKQILEEALETKKYLVDRGGDLPVFSPEGQHSIV